MLEHCPMFPRNPLFSSFRRTPTSPVSSQCRLSMATKSRFTCIWLNNLIHTEPHSDFYYFLHPRETVRRVRKFYITWPIYVSYKSLSPIPPISRKPIFKHGFKNSICTSCFKYIFPKYCLFLDSLPLSISPPRILPRPTPNSPFPPFQAWRTPLQTSSPDAATHMGARDCNLLLQQMEVQQRLL